MEQRPVEALLEEVEPVIRTAVRHKLRVTLSSSDYREQNLDAQDVLSEIRLKLLKKLSPENDSLLQVENFRAYAATVAYHCCSDYLRSKHPERSSLKNCLRRLTEKMDGYALWEAPDGDLICGFAGWRNQAKANADVTLVAQFRNNPSKIPASAIPQKHSSAYTAQDWQHLLDGILNALEAPLPFDDLVSIIASLLGIQDIVDASESHGHEDEQPTAIDLAHSREASAYSVQLARERLRLLWKAIVELQPWHRTAYLLNMPAGELEAFIYYGVAGMQEIGKSLAIKDREFELLWPVLGLEAGLHQEALQARRYVKKFAILWKYLPLEDNAIAIMLGVTRPQVIGYRNKAVERLRRHMKCAR